MSFSVKYYITFDLRILHKAWTQNQVFKYCKLCKTGNKTSHFAQPVIHNQISTHHNNSFHLVMVGRLVPPCQSARIVCHSLAPWCQQSDQTCLECRHQLMKWTTQGTLISHDNNTGQFGGIGIHWLPRFIIYAWLQGRFNVERNG